MVATGRSGYTPAPNAPVAHRLASWSPRLRSRVSSGALTSTSLSRRPAALSGGCSEPVLLAVLRTLQASALRGWTLALVKPAAHRRLAHRPRTSQSITSSQNRLMCCLAYIFPCYKAQQHVTPSSLAKAFEHRCIPLSPAVCVSTPPIRGHSQCTGLQSGQKEARQQKTLSAQETLLCRPLLSESALRVCSLLKSRAQGARTGGATYLPLHCACTALDACVFVARPLVDPTPASTRRGALWRNMTTTSWRMQRRRSRRSVCAPR